MSAFVLADVQLLFGSMELGPFSGEFSFSAEAAMKVGTNFGSRAYTCVLPGLTTATGMVKGFSDYATGAVSTTFNAAQIGTQQAFGIIPNGSAGVAGDRAEFMRGRVAAIKGNMGKVGEINTFELDLTGDYAPVDGYVGCVLASRTTSGLTGTAVNIVNGVPAGRQLFAAQWVTATTGTNLVTTIQSDDNSGFTSSAVAATLPTTSAVGSWQVTGVPTTDSWFRVVSTIATGAFTYAVLIGVL